MLEVKDLSAERNPPSLRTLLLPYGPAPHPPSGQPAFKGRTGAGGAEEKEERRRRRVEEKGEECLFLILFN